MYLSPRRVRLSSAASTSLPRHNSPGQPWQVSVPTPASIPPSCPPACHQRHIWLVYHSGSALCSRPSHGYLGRELIMCWGQPRGQPVPRLRARRLGTPGNTKARGGMSRENISEGEGNYALTSSPLSVFLVLLSSLCPERLFLGGVDRFGSLGRTPASVEVANICGGKTMRRVMFFIQSKKCSVSSTIGRKIEKPSTAHYLAVASRLPQTMRKCKSAAV